MSRRPPIRSRRASLLALLTTALPGCGEAAPDGAAATSATAAPTLVRPRLAPQHPRPRAATVRTATLAIPAELEPWSVRPDGTTATPLGRDGSGGLHVEGPRNHAVAIPGPFDPTTFNQVAVALRTDEVLTMRIVCSRAGERVLSSGRNLFVPAADEVQVVTFDLPRARHVDGPLDELAIEIVDTTDAVWDLVGVELFQRPLVEFLPHPLDGPELIESVNVGRDGVGLSSAEPLVATVDPVPAGAALTFAYGWPEQVRDPGRSAELVVTVAGAGPVTTERYPVGEGPWTEPSWESARIDLAAHAGAAVELRFELAVDGAGEAVCALGELLVAAPVARPTTVLLVTSDTHRADHVEGATRAVEIDTPTLAALARRGTRFEDCLSTTNVTLPSHIALLTATHPRDHGVLTNRATISGDAATLAEAFRAAGFVTWASVSNRYLGRVDTGLGQGFDRIACPREATDDAPTTIARVLDWLPEAEGRPLFCWVHVFDAHTPYTPPAEYLERYGVEVEPGEPRRANPNRSREPEALRARYRGEISFLDASLERLLAVPRFRSGVCAVTADHGEGLGEHGIWWTHNGLYPEVVRVPLILAGPGIPPGQRVERAVRHMDLGRTLLDLAGLAPQPFPGTSLFAGGAAGGTDDAPRFALAAHARHASITSGRWHLVLSLVEQPRSALYPDVLFERHATELYDLVRDPACEADLAGTDLERARRLRAQLCDWLASAEPTGWGSVGVRDDEVLAQMAELGYTTATPPADLEERIDPDCDCEHCLRFR